MFIVRQIVKTSGALARIKRIGPLIYGCESGLLDPAAAFVYAPLIIVTSLLCTPTIHIRFMGCVASDIQDGTISPERSHTLLSSVYLTQSSRYRDSPIYL